MLGVCVFRGGSWFMCTIFLFFWNGKIFINPIFAQDEQRSVRKELHSIGAVYMRNTQKRPLNKHQLINLHLLILNQKDTPTDSRLPEQSPTQPRKLPLLDANFRTRIKSARPIRIQNQLQQVNCWPDKSRIITQADKFRQRQRLHHEAGSGE
jgi:hypothetical protein